MDLNTYILMVHRYYLITHSSNSTANPSNRYNLPNTATKALKNEGCTAFFPAHFLSFSHSLNRKNRIY